MYSCSRWMGFVGTGAIAASLFVVACKDDDSDPPASGGSAGEPVAGAGNQAGEGGSGAGGTAGTPSAGRGGRAGQGGGTGGSGTAGEGTGDGGSSVGGEGGGSGEGGVSSGGEGGEGGGGSLCPEGDPVSDPVTCTDHFTINVTCVGGPCAQQTYLHTYDVTWIGYEFTGTGISYEGATPYEETICGAVADGTLTFHAAYTTQVPGYAIDGTAELAVDQTASGVGTGHDPRGATQAFTLEVSTLNVGCD
jgi:hypothetical protein